MPKNPPNFRIRALLLAFIFVGTIVGETVSISMVVGVAGSQILGKMYLIMLYIRVPD